MSIRKELAQNLVSRLAEHLDYNMNIIDDQGTIIASCDESRVGDFHEAAYSLVRDNREIEIVAAADDLPEGTRPGINLPITYGGLVIGVVGITGDPEEVKNLAYAVKTSVETMVEYEYYKEAMMRRQDAKNQFLGRLLYEEIRDSRELEDFAVKLGYSTDLIRVPILFQFATQYSEVEMLRTIKRSSLHDKQHMTFITVDKDVLIFKPMNKTGSEVFLRFREDVESYIHEINRDLKAERLPEPEACYVGSYQESIAQYREAYRHTLWLISYIRKQRGERERIHFFTDYVMNFMFESIPSSCFYQIFPFVDAYLDRSTKAMLISTIDALRSTNMSIKAAAEKLKIHRNTVSFRLEKFRDLLGLDLLNKSEDLRLSIMLVEYLKVSHRSGMKY